MEGSTADREKSTAFMEGLGFSKSTNQPIVFVFKSVYEIMDQFYSIHTYFTMNI